MPKRQPLVLKKRNQKLQFLKWPLEAVSKGESIPIDPRVKMPNLTAEINIFTAWYQKPVGAPIINLPLEEIVCEYVFIQITRLNYIHA